MLAEAAARNAYFNAAAIVIAAAQDPRRLEDAKPACSV